METWGDHLRKRRLDLGLLQSEVAQILGVTGASIWQWENNYTAPKVMFIPRIIDFLGYAPYAPVRLFPEKLRAYRRAAGLSLKRLAKLTGFDEGTLAKWEHGRGKPTEASLVRMRRFFGNPEGV